MGLGGYNTPGYSNPEFDALVERWNATRDLEEARALVRQAEAIIADDQPYVVLFTTPVIEAYRGGVQYPFTDMIGGIMWFGGFPTTVNMN